jgi:regulator of sigma E protease
MTLLQKVLAFLVALGPLIIVHELGHYLVARWCGVKVLRFSIGIGRILWSRKFGRDQTEWALSALPLGGYVKMLDAREQDLEGLSEQELQREFLHQSVWKRIAIVAAGPAANFLTAILLFTVLFWAGTPELSSKLRIASEQSQAYQAGFRYGDLVTAVNDEPIQTWDQLRWHLLRLALDKQPASLTIKRANPARAGYSDTFPLTLPLQGLTSQDLDGDFLSKLGMMIAFPQAKLVKVEAGGAGKRGGLQDGDVAVQIDGKPVLDSRAFIDMVKAAPGKPLDMRIKRGETFLDLRVVPDVIEQDGPSPGLAALLRQMLGMQPAKKIEKAPPIGRLDVAMPALDMLIVPNTPLQALEKGVSKTWDISTMSIKMIGKMITADVSWKNISGPLSIADYAGQAASIGLVAYLGFIALISVSLGVMNLLPIPVLDGGHLLYYSLEVLTGKPVSERFGEIAQRAGIALLATLMIVAFFNDIVRLMS